MSKSKVINALSLLIVVGAVGMLPGCASTDKYSGINPVQRTANTEMNSIVFVDHALNRTVITKSVMGERARTTVKVEVESSGIRQTPTGNTEVWAVLRNRTDYDLQVEGMTSFYDAGSAPLDDRSSWKRVYLPANSTALYKEVSVDQQAKYFVVELREGR
ncbi:hypothetical protein [Rheinheimera fenheensis]|uniref:hypothetical protein n=1 Tax=Rheinheimera fenheensis TaxID=3152295 RepID=UPI003260FF7C